MSMITLQLYFSNQFSSNKYADVVEQAFLSDVGTTLHLAIPALETLHKSWSTHAGWAKYARFAPALNVAAMKIDEYYEKTTDSPAYVMAMSSSVYFLYISRLLTLPYCTST